jgi:nitroreductase
MLSRFEPTLRERGAGAYRELFWEAGMIGQALYLAAEAAGLRGTGIGCYFDDLFHHALGLNGHHWQSLYHFTVGGPVEDPRLSTSPPYAPRP